jgi:hypothetical protein
MPIIRQAQQKPAEPVQRVEPPRPEPQRLPMQESPSSMVLAQLVVQNAAISEMLKTISGQRVIEAYVQRDAQGLIETIRMTIEEA